MPDNNSIENTKIRPISFGWEFIMGSLSTYLPEVESGNLIDLVSNHPLSWFLVGRSSLEYIRCIDHKISKVPTDEIRSNCKIGFVNFSIGYERAYTTSYVARLFS